MATNEQMHYNYRSCISLVEVIICHFCMFLSFGVSYINRNVSKPNRSGSLPCG